jgi:ribosomal protein L18E
MSEYMVFKEVVVVPGTILNMGNLRSKCVEKHAYNQNHDMGI